MYHEASGTSGMAAAMNGSINLSLPDGWVPEFAINNENCFVIQKADDNLSYAEKDQVENNNLLNSIEKIVIPLYYNDQSGWLNIVKSASKQIVPYFDSGRMADEYYEVMYKNY